MSLRRKVYVLNVPVDSAANLVSASVTGIPMMSIVEGNPSKSIVSWVAKGFTCTTFDAVAETAQVLSIAIGTVVVGKKYTLEYQPNVLYMSGRDANALYGTKKYTYVAAVTTVKTLIDSLVALVNADTSNFAVATNDSDTSLVITDDAGYGLVPQNPGPGNWRLVTNSVTVNTHTLTPGKIAIGAGSVMLAQKAEWTLDKTQLKSGELVYNFDNALPIAGTVYCTFVIKAKYNMQDHGGTIPDLIDEIILYVDNTTSDNYVEDLKTAIASAVTANA